jgi:PP-loop superfamily ATP-utilizing enzyme
MSKRFVTRNPCFALMRLCWLLIREGRCTCLLAVAHRTLGDAVRGMMIADSPSFTRKALASALDLAHSFGVAVEVIATREFENELYVSNPPNRRYFCKAELFTKMEMLAAERGFSALAHGENADDPAHLRPGSKAASGVRCARSTEAGGTHKGRRS